MFCWRCSPAQATSYHPYAIDENTLLYFYDLFLNLLWNSLNFPSCLYHRFSHISPCLLWHLFKLVRSCCHFVLHEVIEVSSKIGTWAGTGRAGEGLGESCGGGAGTSQGDTAVVCQTNHRHMHTTLTVSGACSIRPDVSMRSQQPASQTDLCFFPAYRLLRMR